MLLSMESHDFVEFSITHLGPADSRYAVEQFLLRLWSKLFLNALFNHANLLAECPNDREIYRYPGEFLLAISLG